jgi:hypothetical protein
MAESGKRCDRRQEFSNANRLADCQIMLQFFEAGGTGR